MYFQQSITLWATLILVGPSSAVRDYGQLLLKIAGVGTCTSIPTGQFMDMWTIDRCLGAGDEGEAYLVHSSHVPEAVLKVSKRGPLKPQECAFGKAMKQRAPNNFVDCLIEGTTKVANKQISFAVFEKAPGTELEELLQAAGATGKPVPWLSTLNDVLSFVMQMYGLEEKMMDNETDGVHHIFGDLHTRNIMITDDGQITVIDYGSTLSCSDLAPCNSMLRQIFTKNMGVFLFLDLLLMLLKRTPTQAENVLELLPVKSRSLFLKAFKGGDASAESAENAADAIISAMWEAFRDDEIMLPKVKALLVAGFESLKVPASEAIFPPSWISLWVG